MHTAILAGGCFWCLEAVFSQLQGVLKVQNGYIDGQTESPSYEQVCGGNTGHAEAVKIDFDDKQISYPQLLTVFFAIHDPTTLNRQGNDVGSQYRSSIYPLNASQLQDALAAIAAAQAQHTAPIVTTIKAATPFYPAESEHDAYFFKHPHQGYCQWVIAPKIQYAREQFANLWQHAQ